ncbi:MAG TPA: beta-galactosidase [Candidatus Angelobacter sp.]|nr:beta-galactosidase [Candidatus Angelobacter sp.]
MLSHQIVRSTLSLAAVLLLLSPQARPQSPVPTQIPQRDAIMVGTAWYPEQWPESRWEEDLRLMEAANIKFVRIAEFSWSALEPTEGHYEMDWLERAIAAAAKHHIVSVVGTPTAAPPAWLTQKHPETLRIEPNGQRVTHGNRAHASSTSPVYREYCRKIAEEMARRLGHNPNVAGWQIDNEYGYALMSYDDLTRRQFQDWLQGKYKTLDALNSFWTTAYWSQTYDNWGEIPIPVEGHNPGLMLEWKRFVTDTWNNYQQNQISAIRKYAQPRQFITGNFMGFFDGFDHYVLSEPLTFASWDDYVGSGHLDPDYNGLTHDLTRGFKRENFWVIETQPGAVNWAGVNNFLNKGEVRAMAWQAIAHGADAIGYWQWRSALNGQEQYHGVLVGADGTPVPLYDEVRQLGQEFTKVQEAFRGTSPQSEVALLYSYDSHWAIRFQKHNQKYDDISVLKSYYRALRKLTPSVDVISANVPLDEYKLVAAPDLNVLPKDLADHLLKYVRNGGHLVLGPRSGFKEQHNELQRQRQPGYLADALGARVEQYYALEKDFPVAGDWGSGQISTWAEQLGSLNPDAKVLLRYGKGNGWIDDQPAAVTRTYGKGSITYIGAILDSNLMNAAAEWMVREAGLHSRIFQVTDGVEVSTRSGAGKYLVVLTNFAQEPQKVEFGKKMNLLLAGRSSESVELARYGVEVLQDPK